MTRTAVALLLALALPVTAHARDWDDQRRDRHETGKDRRGMRDDLRDAREAQLLLQEYERTWAALDRNGVRAVELRVQAAIEAELREKSWEANKEAREFQRDRREARDDRRVDPADLPEDRRKLADDRQDYMRVVEYRDRVTAIRSEWLNLRDQRVYPAMVRKHELLVELVRLSRMEVREDARELRDDRGQ